MALCSCSFLLVPLASIISRRFYINAAKFPFSSILNINTAKFHKFWTQILPFHAIHLKIYIWRHFYKIKTPLKCYFRGHKYHCLLQLLSFSLLSFSLYLPPSLSKNNSRMIGSSKAGRHYRAVQLCKALQNKTKNPPLMPIALWTSCTLMSHTSMMTMGLILPCRTSFSNSKIPTLA